jgi:nitroreductase
MPTDITPTRPGTATLARLLEPADVELLGRAATRAPSLHNSQPWAFAFGPCHVELYADATRQLRHADPSGRSLLVSCGAALLNLRVAAEHAGFHPRVRVLPQVTEPTLVAMVEVDHRHRPRQSGALDHLYPAIEARRTNRRPFHPRRIATSVLATLIEAARTEGAMLRVYDDPEEVSRLISLLHEADLIEHGDPARGIETQAWVGGKHRLDGVPLSALGPRPTQRRAAYRDLGHSVGGVRDHATFEAAPTLAVLSTAHDGPADWVRTGQALERLLLEATTAGVAASFLSHPLEHDQLRWLVRSPQTGVGHSQMILRLGYGDEVPATPRRPTEQLLRVPRGRL